MPVCSWCCRLKAPLGASSLSRLGAVLLLNPVAVSTRGDGGHPFGMIEIPGDGFEDAALKGLLRLPAQITLDLARIDGITAIVPGAVFHKCDLITVGLAVFERSQLVQGGANGLHHFQIGFFVVAAHVVSFTNDAFVQHASDGQTVVSHIEPIANLLTVTINGQGLARQGVVDHQGDQLFREMIGPVIVGAVGGEDR